MFAHSRREKRKKQLEEIAEIRMEASRRRPAIGGGENMPNGSPRNCKRTIRSDRRPRGTLFRYRTPLAIAADRRILQTRGVRFANSGDTYARTHRSKSEKERQRYRKRERTARTTCTYTRERQTVTTDTFIPCVLYTSYTYTHCTHLRFYVLCTIHR